MNKKFLRFWFPVILYSGIIFCVSGVPNLSTERPFPFFDKFLHLVEYGILGLLFARALKDTMGPEAGSYKRIIIWTFIFCTFYGATDEFHQLFVIGRQADLFDLLADSIGGLLGGMIYKT